MNVRPDDTTPSTQRHHAHTVRHYYVTLRDFSSFDAYFAATRFSHAGHAYDATLKAPYALLCCQMPLITPEARCFSFMLDMILYFITRWLMLFRHVNHVTTFFAATRCFRFISLIFAPLMPRLLICCLMPLMFCRYDTSAMIMMRYFHYYARCCCRLMMLLRAALFALLPLFYAMLLSAPRYADDGAMPKIMPYKVRR